METKVERDGTKVVIYASGLLNTNTAVEFEKLVDANLPNTEDLTFDFEGLSYMSSAGIRILLKAQKAMNVQGKMRVCHVCDDIMEVFEMTGFLSVLDVV